MGNLGCGKTVGRQAKFYCLYYVSRDNLKERDDWKDKDTRGKKYETVWDVNYFAQNMGQGRALVKSIIIIITCVTELGHLLTRSGLTYLQVSSEVCHDSFCQLGNSVSLSWAVCREAFCLHVVSSSSCIPVVYLEPVLFLIALQCVNLFCNLSKCMLLLSP